MCDNILDRLGVELKIEVFLSYENYNFWDETSVIKEEHYAIKILSSNKEILIQKSDKGNSFVVLNRHNCIIRMNEMLSGASKSRNIDIKSGK